MNKGPSLRVVLGIAIAGACAAGASLAQLPTIASVPQTMADIRDIRPPKPLGSAWQLPVLGGAALLCLGAGGIYWIRRRRRHEALQTPEERALGRLDGVRPLIREGNGREFCIEVSTIVRRYMEEAFGVFATQLTTEEFLRHLARAPIPELARIKPLLADFLASCDLTKFGGWRLSIEVMERMFESARALILAPANQARPSAPVTGSHRDDPGDIYDSFPAA